MRREGKQELSAAPSLLAMTCAAADLLDLLDRTAARYGLVRNCWTPKDIERISEIRELLKR